MIIGLCGFIGSGKNTVADYLIQEHKFKQESFASSLKDVVASAFHWDRKKLEGITEEDRAWRESVDTWWADRLNMPTLTPRWVLQYWGTDVVRQNFHNDMWIYSLQKKIANSNDNFVISDCRFPNEIESIKDLGGKIVWVYRNLPWWYTDAKEALKGNLHSQKILENHNIHKSEYMWLDTEFDMIINNTKDIDHLNKQIELVF